MSIFKLSQTFLAFYKRKETPVHSKKVYSKADEEKEAQDDLTRLFPVMACGEVQEIKQRLIDVRTLYEPRKTQKIRELLPLLDRLKKQSALFGYPLVSDVSNNMKTIIQRTSSCSRSELTALYNDALLLQEILWKKVKGDGGEKGRKILNRLSRLPK